MGNCPVAKTFGEPAKDQPSVLLVNGSPHEFGCTFTALNEVAMELKKLGVNASIFQIGTQPIGGCVACGGCRHNGGECVFDQDVVNRCAKAMREADGIIVGSPVYYAGPNGQLTSLLDRIFFANGRFLAFKPASAVVSCRRGGASATYDRLLKYFEKSNMPIVTSQYWNSVHGNSPDEVRQDKEGLQTMRTLARNMAWLLKCIKHAEGVVPYPEYEPFEGTNFIR